MFKDFLILISYHYFHKIRILEILFQVEVLIVITTDQLKQVQVMIENLLYPSMPTIKNSKNQIIFLPTVLQYYVVKEMEEKVFEIF